MKINKGVEWAVHAAALMAVLPEKAGLSAAALARYHEVPPAYMAKQLQALSRAGIAKTGKGAKGGYRLARLPTEISVLDVVLAVEGRGPAFRCSEIRQNGPCGLKRDACLAPCPIAATLWAAEAAFRDSLARVSLADLSVAVASEMSPEHVSEVLVWIDAQRIDGIE